jgi:outer membrane protein TolC
LCCQDECPELTIEDAVKIALENNYAIKIAANELTIGKTNVSIGNAGMLPRATASIIDNNNIINLSQTRTDGTINSLDNAKNNSLNYGVNLDWTVFDGFKVVKLEQLKSYKNRVKRS